MTTYFERSKREIKIFIFEGELVRVLAISRLQWKIELIGEQIISVENIQVTLEVLKIDPSNIKNDQRFVLNANSASIGPGIVFGFRINCTAADGHFKFTRYLLNQNIIVNTSRKHNLFLEE